MTTELSQSKCEACNIDAPTLSDDEISELQVQIPSWEVISDDGIMTIDAISRNFQI